MHRMKTPKLVRPIPVLECDWSSAVIILFPFDIMPTSSSYTFPTWMCQQRRAGPTRHLPPPAAAPLDKSAWEQCNTCQLKWRICCKQPWSLRMTKRDLHGELRIIQCSHSATATLGQGVSKRRISQPEFYAQYPDQMIVKSTDVSKVKCTAAFNDLFCLLGF